MSYNQITNFLLHSVNNDFLDEAENGQDLDDIDFDELNKIGEDWVAESMGDGGREAEVENEGEGENEVGF